MGTLDEKRPITELQRAEALVHDESFIALVHTAAEAHMQIIREKAGGIDFEDMTPDLRSEMAELQIIILLLSPEQTDAGSIYKVTSTPNSTYIKLARPEEVKNDRIILQNGTQTRSEANPVHQLSIKVTKPRKLDPYRETPEAIVVDQPVAVMNITPERVYLDQGTVKSASGAGIMIRFFEGGCAEIYASKYAGDYVYKGEEPAATTDDDSIKVVIEKLPGI